MNKLDANCTAAYLVRLIKFDQLEGKLSLTKLMDRQALQVTHKKINWLKITP